MKNSRIQLICALVIATNAYSQDPHFSQYLATPMQVNPANTGLLHDLEVVAVHRNQYKSVATPYTSSALSFDMVTSNDRTRNTTLGVGLQVLRDQSGDANYKSLSAGLNLSGIIKINSESKLSVGIMGGYGQRGIDPSDLRWESQYSGGVFNDQFSSNENFTSTNFNYFDAGAGIAYSFGKNQSYITANDGVKGSFGISAFHFGLPVHSFQGSDEKLNSRYMVHGSFEFGEHNTNLTFIPSFYAALQGKQKEILIGNTFRYLLQEGSHYTGFVQSTSLGLGVHYRWMDAVVANIQLDYANYSFGFSYDFNISKLSAVSYGRGAFELFLRFVTPNPFGRTSLSRI